MDSQEQNKVSQPIANSKIDILIVKTKEQIKLAKEQIKLAKERKIQIEHAKQQVEEAEREKVAERERLERERAERERLERAERKRKNDDIIKKFEEYFKTDHHINMYKLSSNDDWYIMKKDSNIFYYSSSRGIRYQSFFPVEDSINLNSNVDYNNFIENLGYDKVVITKLPDNNPYKDSLSRVHHLG
jgi:hypothetical protein